MKKIIVIAILSSILLNSCVMEETTDLASLLVGSYIGIATDNFSTEDKQKVIITRISDNEIEITPDLGNLINSSFSLKITQDGNYIRHASDQMGLSFEAKASKKSIPLKFSTNVPVQTFDGGLVK